MVTNAPKSKQTLNLKLVCSPSWYSKPTCLAPLLYSNYLLYDQGKLCILLLEIEKSANNICETFKFCNTR